MTAKKHIKHWSFATVHENDMGEFKDIPNTSGTYKISSDGVVVSKRRRSLPDEYWVVLKNQKSTNAKPFQRVAIFFNGTTQAKMCQVSRLLLEAWVGPPPSEFHVAAHRNGVPDDDRLDNLLWAKSRDVVHGQICRGTAAHGEKSGNARWTLEQVEAARRMVIEFGVPANLLATAMGIPQPRVREWLTRTWDSAKWEGLENPLLVGSESR